MAEIIEKNGRRSEAKLIMEGQFRTGFMLGVEFGFKQAEKGRNFDYALDKARKALSPKSAVKS